MAMNRLWFEILVFFLAFFALCMPTSAQEINVGDSIYVFKMKEVSVATAKAIGRKGPAKNFKRQLVDLPLEGESISILDKYNATQFRIGYKGQQYLLSIGNPQDKSSTPRYSVLYFFHQSFVDSLCHHYFDQEFYDYHGKKTTFFRTVRDDYLTIQQLEWRAKWSNEITPYAAHYKPGSLSGTGEYVNYSHVIDDRNQVRSVAEVVAERDKRWPTSYVDSLRNRFVGDTLVLGVNLNDIRDSIDVVTPGLRYYNTSRLEKYPKYSKVVADSIYVNILPAMWADYVQMEYRMIIRPVGKYFSDAVTIHIDDITYPHLFLTDEEYAAYLEEQRRMEQKRLEYIALSEQEWLEQQRALNEREMQFLEIYTKVYGEETGLDIWWGRIKFGFTEDMCKNAYRNSGMYRIKEHVSTPLGDAKQIHFLERQTILYFIDDCLIGVTIYGKTTWDNVF